MTFYDSNDNPSASNYNIYYESDFVFLGDLYFSELKNEREKINWDIVKERNLLFDRVVLLINRWKGKLPDLGEIFQPKEIDWLLTRDVWTLDRPDPTISRFSLIHFVIKTGYKDSLIKDKDNKPLLRRTTPVHRAAMNYECIFRLLLNIYDRFDVNYIDEFGFTHFHAACMYGCEDIVAKFLELGQNPDGLAQETDVSVADPPLHLALTHGRKEVIELLLRSGANANLANANGWTPLHIICKDDNDNCDLAELFFKINDDKRQAIQLNAVDNLGRTPLQCAVAQLCPGLVEILLNRGADLSSFVFPTETYFVSRFQCHHPLLIDREPKLVSDVLVILERLMKRGYELSLRGALTIMKFFDHIGKPIYKVYLFLEDLDTLKPCRICESDNQWTHLCSAHKSVMMSRTFFECWALKFFFMLTGHRLPILCCEIIIKQLSNEDLLRMCMAVEIVIKEQSQTHDVHDKVNEIEQFQNLLIDK
ncbi:uncharacterized protein LOC106658877 [Trichogramma pretiosum]|uniref:uncharacterized protein LOC106658877 n=1 Tax=Trichogramma pretiosum TaxID=7493 RepID=UPI0006C9D7B8|nr:uncharacterized protein LOC106658877 [Trichogramma pretiosum]